MYLMQIVWSDREIHEEFYKKSVSHFVTSLGKVFYQGGVKITFAGKPSLFFLIWHLKLSILPLETVALYAHTHPLIHTFLFTNADWRVKYITKEQAELAGNIHHVNFFETILKITNFTSYYNSDVVHCAENINY